MQFSVKWIGAAPAYVGMLFGAWQVWRLSSGTSAFGIGAGVLIGGGLALPLAGCSALAALLAGWLLREHGFAVQYAVTMLVATSLYTLVVRAVGASLPSLDVGSRAFIVDQAALLCASFALALLLMKLWPAPSR